MLRGTWSCYASSKTFLGFCFTTLDLFFVATPPGGPPQLHSTTTLRFVARFESSLHAYRVPCATALSAPPFSLFLYASQTMRLRRGLNPASGKFTGCLGLVRLQSGGLAAVGISYSGRAGARCEPQARTRVHAHRAVRERVRARAWNNSCGRIEVSGGDGGGCGPSIK